MTYEKFRKICCKYGLESKQAIKAAKKLNFGGNKLIDETAKLEKGNN